MKQISIMELQVILDALSVAKDELDAAQDDGWVITTDVEAQIDDSTDLIQTIKRSPDIEMG